MEAQNRVRVRVVGLGSVGSAVLEALARLNIAPAEFVVLSEETDWGFVGGDLRDAIEQAEAVIDVSRERYRPIGPVS